jgi:8-hydroxy-5-deazaflavin:NADPH oxidoreductase
MSLSDKTIAIIGGGSVGSTLAKSLLQSEQVGKVLIGARDPTKTKAALAEQGLSDLEVGSLPEAIQSASVLILAVPGAHTDEGIQSIAQSLIDQSPPGGLKDKIILDATNPLTEFPELSVRWSQGTSGGEVLQQCLPDCKVYKCFNTIGREWMERSKALTMDMLYAGPDADIDDVVSAVGFTPRYVGPIRYARNLEAMAELWIHCAIPPLPSKTLGRQWGFVMKGDLEK